MSLSILILKFIVFNRLILTSSNKHAFQSSYTRSLTILQYINHTNSSWMKFDLRRATFPIEHFLRRSSALSIEPKDEPSKPLNVSDRFSSLDSLRLSSCLIADSTLLKKKLRVPNSLSFCLNAS